MWVRYQIRSDTPMAGKNVKRKLKPELKKLNNPSKLLCGGGKGDKK